MLCAFSNTEIRGKSDALRFALSPDGSIIFDLHDSLAFLPRESVLYIRWEFIKEALCSDLFARTWPAAVVKFTLEDLRSACLENALSLVSLAKKSGFLTIGRNNIVTRLSKLRHQNQTRLVAILQAYDSSRSERFREGCHPIEDFNSKALSQVCGKENIHYLLVEGDFARKIFDIKDKVKYLD
jgi:hypothetical protein